MRQYKVGDRVQIVDCAHPIWEPDDTPLGWVRTDLRPELVGKIGTVEMLSNSDSEIENLGRGKGIRFDDSGFSAWYYDWQLKLVEKAEYRILLKFWEHIEHEGYLPRFDLSKIEEIINNFLNEQDNGS